MAELIVDVGMYDGTDTAYYLASGYDVVAVEANPEFCKAPRERFAAEIAAGRLTICNVGIAEQAGELEFWVSDVPEWSSFHKESATRTGASASSIVVPTIRFADLLNEFPAPLYVKIDIERNDALCIRELERCSSLPTYVSFELSFAQGRATDDIQLLMELGYHAFKCVRQNDWREITPDNVQWQGRMRKLLAGVDSHHTMAVLQLLHYRRPRNYRRSRTNGWRYTCGGSGPLARELPGRWMTYRETLAVWENLATLDKELNADDLGEWYDIHATRR